jgi:hypothetical protein
MDGAMAAWAEHGEVIWFRLTCALGEGDAVVGFDQV